MCGIAGILRVHPPGTVPPPPDQAIPESWLDILDNSIKHRGPDGHGRFRDRATRPDGSVVDVALVHRRLSIIDPKDGHQPMVSLRTLRASEGSSSGGAQRASEGPQGRPDNDLVAVIFNGCIYNHRDLRKELTAAGHRFVTDHSDTEVLIHGWREWGKHLPEHLDGMFAWAAWSASKASLFLARDRAGEKPLYVRYHMGPPWTLAFASMPLGLRGLPLPADEQDRARALNSLANRSVRAWIRDGSSVHLPMYGLRTIEPGGTDWVRPAVSSAGDAVEDAAHFQHDTHDWCCEPQSRSGSLSVHDLDALLSKAVEERLEADVPIGCFLSGGVDSSLITALARRHRPDIAAFTVRMPDARYDESPQAAAVANAIGVRHEILDCRSSPAEDLVRLITRLGLPFGDSSLLPTYWVSRAAAQSVKVALTGDGGDELFLGYERYRAARLLSFLGPLRPAFVLLAPLVSEGGDPRGTRAHAARFIRAAADMGYDDLTAIFSWPEMAQLGRARIDWPSGLHRLLSATRSWLKSVPAAFTEPFTGRGIALAVRHDFRYYLPEDILRKTDTASMAVPIEVRAPMLDREVYEAATRARIDNLMPRGPLKGLLKQVAARYIPDEIINRPKQGFAIPIGDWFRTDYGSMKTLLLDHLNSTEPWGSPSLGIDLNMKFVRQMLDEHMTSKRDHSQRLYMLLVLSIWAKSLSP